MRTKEVSPAAPDLRPKRLADIKIIVDAKRHIVTLPYSIENLHRAAEWLGIGRGWFHRDHYDMPKKKIDLILKMSDRIVSTRSIVGIVKGEITDINYF